MTSILTLTFTGWCGSEYQKSEDGWSGFDQRENDCHRPGTDRVGKRCVCPGETLHSDQSSQQHGTDPSPAR